VKETSPRRPFIGCGDKNASSAVFCAIPEAAANWYGFAPMLTDTVPIERVIGRPVPDTFWIGQPKNEGSFSTTVGHISLKVAKSLVNRSFQPRHGFVRVKRIHDCFEAGDNKCAVIDKS
jgi:hypothetical protein